MSIDQARLGEFLADTMEQLEHEYGDNATLGEALIIVEVNLSDGDSPRTDITYYSTASKAWEQIGLLVAATLAAEDNKENPDD